MREVVLRAPDDYEGWRDAARALAEGGVPPEDVAWRADGDAPDLFVSPAERSREEAAKRALRVPRRCSDA